MVNPEKNFRCVLTNAPLISIGSALDRLKTDKSRNELQSHINDWTSGELSAQLPISKILRGKLLGFSGEDTTTYMSHDAYQDFYNWVTIKMLSGDKHINWVVSSMDKEAFATRAESLVTTDEERKHLASIKASLKTNKKAMTTLGDLDVLQALKLKLESNGN